MTEPSAVEATLRVNLNRNKLLVIIIGICLGVELLLALGDWFIHFNKMIDYSSVRKIFNVAKESSLGTWFNVIQTFVIGCVAWSIAALCKLQNKKKFSTYGWILVGCFFVYLSADDAAEIHERISPFIRSLFPKGEAGLLDSNPSYNWQFIFLPMFGCVGIALLIFLWKELNSWRLFSIVIASIGIMAVAVSLDFIEGLDDGHKYDLIAIIKNKFELREYTVSHSFRLIEEVFEMISMTGFFFVFLKYLTLKLPTITIRTTRPTVDED